MDIHGDVAALSHLCVKGFAELLQSLSAGNEFEGMQSRVIENDYARFKIWCGNLGALQRGRSSLDARLRDSTVMRDTVVRFLHELHDFLAQSLEVTTGIRKPWEENLQEETSNPDALSDGSSDESDTSDTDETELAECQSGIHDTLAHLYRLSFKIRNAGHRLQSAKAIMMTEVDKETGEDLFLCYAEFDRQYVLESLQQFRRSSRLLAGDLKPTASADDHAPSFLVERLSKAITNRRRYFAYWRKHALKLSLSSINTSPSSMSQDRPLPVRSRDHAHKRQAVTETNQNLLHESSLTTVVSGTDFSKYAGDLDDKQAIRGFETMDGEIARECLEAHQALAMLYAQQNMLEEAEGAYCRALDGYRTSDSSEQYGVYKCLGEIYRRQGKLKEAKQAYEKALEGFEQISGRHSKITSEISKFLCDIKQELGEIEEVDKT